MISVILLVLSLLRTVLDQALASKLPSEVIDALTNAIAELEKVRGSDVSFQQLEDLRVKPSW